MYVIKAGNILLLNFEGFFGICGGRDFLTSGHTVWKETVAVSILASICCLKCFLSEYFDGVCLFVLFWGFLSSVISEKKIAKLFKLNVYLCVWGVVFLIHWYLFHMLWVQK